MKIPKSFELFGSTITVAFDNDKCEAESAYGVAQFKINAIKLSNKAQGVKIDPVEIEVSFVHEAIHFVLVKLGYQELSNDEKFMKQISGAVHQCLTTQKF